MQTQEKLEVVIPQYKKIAIDINARIVDGRYKVGDKLHARSKLASQYGVSSETARRAMCVLADLDIVSLEPSSGILIKSYEKAVEFAERNQQVKTIADLQRQMLESIKRQRKEQDEFSECWTELLERIDRFQSSNPFLPLQVEVRDGARFLNRTVAEAKFWQNTGATVIAIRRDNQLMLSPGPYAVLRDRDIIYFVGVDGCFERVTQFLYG